MNNNLDLDIVIPVHNEEDCLENIVDGLTETLGAGFNLIFVDDGSTDNSWIIIEGLKKKYSFIRGIKFSRNFGKDAAIFAGLEKSKASRVVTMDADGQHPAKDLRGMLKLQEEKGAAIVNGVKKNRMDNSVFYRFFAFIFNFIFHKASGLDLRNSSDFKVLNGAARDEILKCNDHNIFYRALCVWVGFKQVSYEFDVGERMNGTQSWSTKTLFKYALNAFVYHSDLPIKMILWLGIFVLLVTVYLLGALFWYFLFGELEEGYPTVIVLLLMNSGLSLISIGILGLYMRTTLTQTVKRPRFLVEEEV